MRIGFLIRIKKIKALKLMFLLSRDSLEGVQFLSSENK